MKEQKNGKLEKRLYGPAAIVFNSVNTGSWRILRPAVDESRCVKCDICASFCPAEVISVHKNGGASGVVEIDWAYCKGCGICAEVCPKDCIEMVKENENENEKEK
ncbi:MAG: 4Fe-4S binding protein [Candidatus Aminicenantes bacterium]|nr:4Fe-4S binding protein [Candidatus Aminicenantes bacterium]